MMTMTSLRTALKASVAVGLLLAVVLPVILLAQTAQYTKIRVTSTAADALCVGHDSQSPTAAQCDGGIYAGGSALISAAGVMTVSGFGTHTFSAGSNSDQILAIANTTAGDAARAMLRLTTNSASHNIYALDDGFSSSGVNVAGALVVQSGDIGGLVLAATDTVGDISFRAGGSGEVGRIDGTQFFWGDSSNANNTFGVTINQLAATNHALTLKSSDVATALTSGAP